MQHAIRVAALFCLLASPAFAQSATVTPLPLGCGSGNITNSQGYLTEDLQGRLCGADANGGNTYNTIAASQTAQVLSATSGGTTGKIGDYLSHCVIVPATTSPGAVTIYDNTTAIYSFPGGASSVSNLVPIAIPVGSISVVGAWEVTTGANVSVVCTGRFH